MAESAKAKKAPQELTEKQLRFRRLAAQGAREGAVIALIALCIYLSMALVTFSPSDPGWASIGHDTSVQNYAGRTGAWLASLFMDFFGHVAYLFPVMIADAYPAAQRFPGLALAAVHDAVRWLPVDPSFGNQPVVALFRIWSRGFLGRRAWYGCS
jgi:hypothetical protein